MRRRAFTLVELLVTAVLLTVAICALVLGTSFLGRQTEKASRSTDQVDAALNLLETVRIELSHAVLNPMAHPSQHLGNSILVSRPNGTSIQFVTERIERGELKRCLVYYEVAENDADEPFPEPSPAPSASPTGAPPEETAPVGETGDRGPRLLLLNRTTAKRPADDKRRKRVAADTEQKAHLRLKKTVWRFEHRAPWYNPIQFPPGWNEEWIGPIVEKHDRYADLGLEDIRWQYFVPTDSEGRAFLRVKLVLRAHGTGVLMPFSTVMSLPSPDMPVNVSDCPCLFAPCFDKDAPDCHCCSGGSR